MFLTPPVPAFGRDSHGAGTPVCPGGWGRWGKRNSVLSRAPSHPQEEQSRELGLAAYGVVCRGWCGLTRVQQPPTASLPCPCPCPPTLCPQGQWFSRVCQARPCPEDALTSQGVLGHTEAQGLQPVVDVRFSHRKLEFCRGQRLTLVTGALTTTRKYARCRWLHLQGEGLVRLPARTWGDRQDCHGQCVALGFN